MKKARIGMAKLATLLIMLFMQNIGKTFGKVSGGDEISIV
jgi:hypothetical protein